MSTVKADNFTWKTGEATAQIGTTVTGPQIVYGIVKTWINYNGTSGSTAVRASYNISSTVYNTTGNYTFNFTNAILDGNFSGTDSVNRTYQSSAGYGMNGMMYARTPTSLSYLQTFYNGTGYDAEYVAVHITR